MQDGFNEFLRRKTAEPADISYEQLSYALKHHIPTVLDRNCCVKKSVFIDASLYEFEKKRQR